MTGIDRTTLRFTILGCGSVGRVFAHELREEAAELRLWSRTAASAELLAAEGGAGSVAPSFEDAVSTCDCALLCVSDEAIEETAVRIASCRRHDGAKDAAPIALHPNGWYGPELLDPLAAAGWATGKMHPLCAIPPGADPHHLLRDAWFACAGAPRARAVASSLVAGFGGRELSLRDAPGSSRAYHAAASFLANGTVALAESARRVFASACENPEDALPVLKALLESAIRDLGPQEPGAILTGPASRGSTEIVRGHLDTLRAHDEDTARTYALLVGRMLELAEARGSIDASQRAEIERLLTE